MKRDKKDTQTNSSLTNSFWTFRAQSKYFRAIYGKYQWNL